MRIGALVKFAEGFEWSPRAAGWEGRVVPYRNAHPGEVAVVFHALGPESPLTNARRPMLREELSKGSVSDIVLLERKTLVYVSAVDALAELA